MLETILVLFAVFRYKKYTSVNIGEGGVMSCPRHVHIGGRGWVKKWPIFVHVMNERPLVRTVIKAMYQIIFFLKRIHL